MKEYDHILGSKAYLVVDPQKRVYGRYKTLPEAYNRQHSEGKFKSLHVIVEVSLIDFDQEIYFNLQGQRIA